MNFIDYLQSFSLITYNHSNSLIQYNKFTQPQASLASLSWFVKLACLAKTCQNSLNNPHLSWRSYGSYCLSTCRQWIPFSFNPGNVNQGVRMNCFCKQPSQVMAISYELLEDWLRLCFRGKASVKFDWERAKAGLKFHGFPFLSSHLALQLRKITPCIKFITFHSWVNVSLSQGLYRLYDKQLNVAAFTILDYLMTTILYYTMPPFSIH